MRTSLVAIPVAAALLALPACSRSVTGAAVPSAAPAAAAAPAVPSAHVEFTKDPRGVAKQGTYDLAGGSDTTCGVYPGSLDIGISDPAAPEGSLEAIGISGSESSATVRTSFNATVAGTDYSTSYENSEGKVGAASAKAETGADGVVTVTFEATTWDGAVYRGTITCKSDTA